MKVLSLEFGDLTCAIWRHGSKLSPPWSPPIFAPIWSSGMFTSWKSNNCCSLYLSSKSVTKLHKSLTYTMGVSLRDCPVVHDSSGKNKCLSSTTILSCTMCSCSFRSELSLVNVIPAFLSIFLCNLYCVVVSPHNHFIARPVFLFTKTFLCNQSDEKVCLF